jgi:HPt (histidine-containing phosphotransfer) domain-containing protein
MPDIQDVTQEMKFIYLKRRTAELIECQKALKLRDFRYLEKVGHQVKGNAVSFGFEKFLPIAVDLEGAAQSKDARRLESVLQELSESVMKTVKGFEEVS